MNENSGDILNGSNIGSNFLYYVPPGEQNNLMVNENMFSNANDGDFLNSTRHIDEGTVGFSNANDERARTAAQSHSRWWKRSEVSTLFLTIVALLVMYPTPIFVHVIGPVGRCLGKLNWYLKARRIYILGPMYTYIVFDHV